jgi:coenzyme F420-reducing hydrogenase delta subunit/ferredoxin
MSFEPKIIAFLCTWCSYTGADTAGIARLKSPSNIRAIRVPCSGRVAPEWIMRAFEQGADGVLVLGCHIGECHYESGNHRTAKRIPVLRELMAYTGMEPERLRLDWVSASEGERYSRITGEFTETVRALGPLHYHTDLKPNATSHPFWQPVNRPASPVELLENQRERWVGMTQEIQQVARELLANGDVGCVIGYEVGSRHRTRPAFITKPDDVDRLVWNMDCTHNLTNYLGQKLVRPQPGKMTDSKNRVARVAVVVKACDSRAIQMLLAEKRIEREQVHVIGVICDGIRQGAGFDNQSEGQMQRRCLACADQKPVIFDNLIGQSDEGCEKHPVMKLSEVYGYPSLEGLPTSERMEFWLSQFDRCLRCYACRQTCPMCDCPTCLYERDDSLWVGMGIRLDEKRTFHLGRAYHLAGRCVGCDECERVCPMEIPLSLLNQKLAAEMQNQFGYQAGLVIQPAPFITILGAEEKHP